MTKKAGRKSSSSSSSSSSDPSSSRRSSSFDEYQNTQNAQNAQNVSQSNVNSWTSQNAQNVQNAQNGQANVNLQELFNELLGDSYRRLCGEGLSEQVPADQLSPDTLFADLETWAISPEAEQQETAPQSSQQQPQSGKGKRKHVEEAYFTVEQVKKRAYKSHQAEQQQQGKGKEKLKPQSETEAEDREYEVLSEAAQWEAEMEEADEAEVNERQDTVLEAPTEDFTPLKDFLEETLFDFDPSVLQESAPVQDLQPTLIEPPVPQEEAQKELLAQKLLAAEQENQLLQEKIKQLEAAAKVPAPVSDSLDLPSSSKPRNPVPKNPAGLSAPQKTFQKPFPIGFVRNRRPASVPVPAFTPKFLATPEFQHIVAAVIFLTYMTSLFIPSAGASFTLVHFPHPHADRSDPQRFPASPNGTTQLPVIPDFAQDNAARRFSFNFSPGDEKEEAISSGFELPLLSKSEPLPVEEGTAGPPPSLDLKRGEEEEEEAKESEATAQVAPPPQKRIFIFPGGHILERPLHEEDPSDPVSLPDLLAGEEGENREGPENPNPEVMFAMVPRTPSVMVLFMLLGMMGAQRKKDGNWEGIQVLG